MNSSNFFLDFSIYVIPIIFYTTIFGENVLLFYLLVLIVNFVISTMIIRNRLKISQQLNGKNKYKNNSHHNEIQNEIIKLSISLLRVSIFIITSITIFAVEFKIYPRIHAKRKRYGISLLDLTVGLFMFCNSSEVISDHRSETTMHSFKR